MQASHAVVVERLFKTFRVPRRYAGLKSAFAALFRREHTTVRAVENLAFSIEQGEIVGFLGPNGAGKTTTLKMLSGLLVPTSGEIRVNGFHPWDRSHAFLRSITLVMGQKRQLSWDLPAVDTFEFQRAVFDIDRNIYEQRLKELLEMLKVADEVYRPVRQLSLGERMKCELIAALLHAPRVLFLDEPTIGMDVATQHSVREFIAEYNRRTGATVLLTSHYMQDVSALCRRILVIAHGRLAFDGSISELTQRLHPHRRISLTVETVPPRDKVERLGQIVAFEDDHLAVDVPSEEVSSAVGHLLEWTRGRDLTVEEIPLDQVMRHFMSEDRSATEGAEP